MSNIGNKELIQNFLPIFFTNGVKKTRFLDSSQCLNVDFREMTCFRPSRKRLLKFVMAFRPITGILSE